MSNLNKVFSALSDETRRKILLLLRQGSLPAGEIADHFAISKPSITFHLNLLREAGLVYSRKEGQYVIYTLQISVFEEAMMLFMDMLKKERKENEEI
ncbi:MAG: autorepressor SdpR family transcription factor [Candidatus Marinimicrobia bacterium]|jgi:DNA-binding transcriptional ArsR family regulator|nr:autorepressor SdpR family transcription factor [Candidatus Neomarinimicrobiota bacterium]MDD5710208.1 autorepressor SdpR family transcription factor [Candidatus Neomarinimicrobiota bacterium]MDX9777639.1 autorepressor SdpR family transcription factor [bacterium]